jgi:hypothetical protein
LPGPPSAREIRFLLWKVVRIVDDSIEATTP